MRVLIAYGSKMGGTHGLANWLGHDLQEMGDFDVDVRQAGMVESIDSYDAVIVGGALYSLRWHPEARRFVRRFQAELKEQPVWFFSSGPLDDSTMHKKVPPVRFVSKTMERIGARGHMTFGGRLPDDYHGGAGEPGDWRDPGQVRGFALDIAAELVPVA